MRNIIGWLASFLCGSLGWWLGAFVNIGVAVVLGALAGAAGLYYGYRWFDENLR